MLRSIVKPIQPRADIGAEAGANAEPPSAPARETLTQPVRASATIANAAVKNVGLNVIRKFISRCERAENQGRAKSKVTTA